MLNDKIVTIKGQLYDSVTGKRTEIKKPTNATLVHSIAQKSQTLYRRSLKKPAILATPPVRKIGHNMDIARGKGITHFAPQAITAPVKPATKMRSDIMPTRHPLVLKAEKMRSAVHHVQQVQPKVSSTTEKPLKTIKEEAITEALNKPTAKPKKINRLKKYIRPRNIIGLCIILLIAAGFVTYYKIPSFSVRVASAQAGIEATYPDYQPDGYSVVGPVSYDNNEVTIKFQSNTNNTKFVIKQVKSSWDSTAVKNMVDEDSKGVFITTEERGLTIFTYNGNGAWVNGGILYTVIGDARLTNDQIRRIATSL